MAIKKYPFDKILKEYNEIYGSTYKLPPEASNVIILHDIGISKFHVTFTNKDGIRKSTKPLHDFICSYISRSITWSVIENIMLSKENDKLSLKIKTWPSSKIRYAYLYSNYFAKNVGNLGKSCMRVKEMQKALNFYIKNKVKIVVVIDDSNKIHARALLWENIKSTKLKTPFTYLDRVYARTDTLCSLFYDLAKENKWRHYPSTTVNQMDKYYYKKDIIIAGMCHLPFMDTFRYLYSKDNLLTSNSGLRINKSSSPYINLNEHTNCGYYPELDPNRIQEAFTGAYISKKDAVFVKRYKDSYDGYVLKKNIVDIKGAYYSNHDNTIVKTKLDGYIFKENSVDEAVTNEKINKDTAVFSAKHNKFIHKSNAVEVFQYGVGSVIFHKKDADVVCFKDKWYHVSQCFVNYDRERRNISLLKQKFHPWIEDEVFVTYPDDFVVRKGDLIPKEHAIIAYDLTYSPVLDDIEYQKVYRTSTDSLLQLTTGEWIVNSRKNKMYLKKFNNKWCIERDFELSDKKQLQFAFMNKEKK